MDVDVLKGKKIIVLGAILAPKLRPGSASLWGDSPAVSHSLGLH